jgi:hypothetical protein
VLVGKAESLAAPHTLATFCQRIKGIQDGRRFLGLHSGWIRHGSIRQLPQPTPEPRPQ